MNGLRLTAGLILALAASLGAGQSASVYPSRSIRLVVDTSPGGLTDLLARLCAEGLAQSSRSRSWWTTSGDLAGRGHFEKGFRHGRPDA